MRNLKKISDFNVKMNKIQYLKLIFYSKTKHIICNLTQFEPIMVWKQFLVILFLLTVIIVITYTVIGDDINSDPLVKILVVPKIGKDDNYETDYYFDESNTLIDLPNFKYTLRPSCYLNNITKILLVTSFAGNVESRSALRRAYPSSVLSEIGIQRVFLLGAMKDGQSEIKQNSLISENKRFSDLLQGNFYEAYRNLTYKHIMGLKWVSDLNLNCDNKNIIKYIIKMDDDIIVDVNKLINLIRNYEINNVSFDMMGYVLDKVRAIRLKANKWYVTKNEYDSNIYPKFLSGWLYIIKPDTARKLVKLSHDVKYFWIDDVYVTGILGHIVQAKYVDIHENFTLHPEFFECCIRDKLSCHIIAGPNGGDNDLQLRYEKHIKSCVKNSCPEVTLLKHNCITQRKMPSIGKGFADIERIQL